MKQNGAAPPRTAAGLTPAAPFDGVLTDAAAIRATREQLAASVLPSATQILPAATDTTSQTSERTQASRRLQAEWVDLLAELEALKNTATATQARLAVMLEESTKSEEARQSIRAERRGRGVPNQVGAAMQSSPHSGVSFLNTARAWITDMPHTFNALRTGVLSQWRATLLVRETAHLAAEHRAQIDEEICGPAHLTELARLGTRRLVARIKERAGQLDVHACVRRLAKATGDRCVSIRPAPDLMVYLTALVPIQQGVQAYAQLKKQAEAARAAGAERRTGQIMADTLIERVTGREPGQADDVPVTINLLVSDQTLLQEGDEPGILVEGMPLGAGSVPAPVARNLAAHGISADAAWLRTIYVDPKGRLLATTSASRFHPPGLAALLRTREQGICASPWCDAPVRHIDHITPHAHGGRTSLENGQGLCARCNHAKQAPGWAQETTAIDGRHAVRTVTPTGHAYIVVAPTPPEPVREPVGEPVREPVGKPAPAWSPATGLEGPRPGRVPRSRYSIGCTAPGPGGTIAYRPRRRRRRTAGRSTHRGSRPDLSWAHCR